MLHSLQNALPIVAAALGRRFGVAVGVGGTEACTDGRHIQIPDVGDDPAARALAWGYLAHEAGHVRYTDFDAYEPGTREGPLQTILQNRIEDARIERALARPYPGTRHTIGAVLGRLLADRRLTAPTPEDDPAAVLAGYLLLTLRVTVLDQTLLLAQAKQAEASLRAVFPPAFIRRLRALMAAVPTLTSTTESVALARRTRALIEEEAQAAPPQQAADQGQADSEVVKKPLREESRVL
jgi:cobaltochelatase CobT